MWYKKESMENNTHNEHLGLMSPELLEKSPVIKSLMEEFESKLPDHFGKARFVPAPPMSALESVIRADCQNCRTRAVVHVVRENYVLKIKERDAAGAVKISYDRTDNCCEQCKKLI